MSDADHQSEAAAILVGDCITRMRELHAGSAKCCITSPPYYGLRDYGAKGQIGIEPTPEAYITRLVDVFREVRRVLADDGTLWLNLGDSYKDKQLLGVPWRVALALQADGWVLRQEIIWHKPNPMPKPLKDRCTDSHEHLFLLAKSKSYYYDAESIREEAEDRPLSSWAERRKTEPSRRGDPGISGHVTTTHTLASRPGRNKRDVWTIAPKPFKGAHFAVFPPALVEPCVLAGSARGDVVLDPFTGSGTTGMVALEHGRCFVGTELNPEYAALAWTRINTSAATAVPPTTLTQGVAP